MRCLPVCLMTCGTVFAGALGAQESPPPTLPRDPFIERLTPPGGASAEEGPAPGAPGLSLGQAVGMALARNFNLLSAADSVAAARQAYSVSKAQFYPQLTPRYARGEGTSALTLDLRQRIPWTGGSLAAGAAYRSEPDAQAPLTRRSDVSVILTQPLLRGLGPNAAFFDLRNSRRLREGQERSFELTRQRVAVEVARAFYDVVQQRMLLTVARQSFERSEGLGKASEARLQVGLVSKLDVFRAQLLASQAEDAMVRSEANLQDALERFRFLLGLPAHEPVEPEAVALAESLEEAWPEPLPVLVERALSHRLDLQEARDLVDDARRSASLARQNLLPQVDLNVIMTQGGFGPGFGSALRAGDRRVDVSLSASLPLERTQDRATATLANLGLEAAERNLRQRELEVEAEVRTARRELDQIRKSAGLQRQGVEVAEQQHRLASLRYERGLASNFDVVDAEGSLVQARSALASLLTRYQAARFELLRVVGTLDVGREFGP
jgi:outer membrane protein